MSDEPSKPAPPPGLQRRGRGRALWREVVEALELDTHERALLHEACRCLDQLDELDRIVKAVGTLLPDGRIQPAVVESRQQRIALARLIASLRLPEDMADPNRRPQRRGSARGIYVLPERKDLA